MSFHGDVANISEASTPDVPCMHRATYRFTCIVCGLKAKPPHVLVANSQGLCDIATNMATTPSKCVRLHVYSRVGSKLSLILQIET
jgi:hypothetical protein